MLHRSSSPQPVTVSHNVTVYLKLAASHFPDWKPSFYCLLVFNICIIFVMMSESLSFLFIRTKFQMIFKHCWSKSFQEHFFCVFRHSMNFLYKLSYLLYITSHFCFLFLLTRIIYLIFDIVIDLLLSSNLSPFCNCIHICVLFIEL
jgi:hypothetical protein